MAEGVFRYIYIFKYKQTTNNKTKDKLQYSIFCTSFNEKEWTKYVMLKKEFKLHNVFEIVNIPRLSFMFSVFYNVQCLITVWK